MIQQKPSMRGSIPRTLKLFALLLSGLLLWAGSARAQRGVPRLGYAFPAGGQRGTSFEIKLGGQYLKAARAVLISGQGVEAKVVHYLKPPNRGQANRIRQKLREMWRAEQAKRKKEGKKPLRKNGRPVRGIQVSEVDSETWDMLARLARLKDCSQDEFIAWTRESRNPKRQPNAQLEEIVTLAVTIEPKATPGRRELRLVTGQGLTNPIFIEVGSLREYTEQEPNDRSPDTGIEKSLPVLINGQILPGEVDRFTFTAKKNHRIVAMVSARQLIPYLADAVPGWFQATLSLSDESGRRLVYVDDYKFHPDPVLSFKVPADGRYTLEIRDSIYRGRQDFVYRLSLGEIPFATSAWPLGARNGHKTKIRLKGWNLPTGIMNVDPAEGAARISSIASVKGIHASNSLPLALDVLREESESEPNDSPRLAQGVAIPALVNGRIRKPEDRDYFRFHAKAGESYHFEILARRLGSPLDSLLQVLDSEGGVLASNDDFRDEEAGLTTHQADSRLIFKAPATGSYLLRISDTQHKGSMEHSYRLRMTRPEPDFALRVVPSSVNLRAGMSTPITIHALRKDGFDGDIRLQLLNSPQGFHLDGALIPRGQHKLRMTLMAPRRAKRQPFRLHFVGIAKIRGEEVQRTAIPAEDMMQAFLWRHLVPSQDIWALVQGRSRGGSEIRLTNRDPLRIPRGGSTWVSFQGPRQLPWKQLAIELDNAPKGMRTGKIQPQGKGAFRIEILADKTVPLDLRGNLILQAFYVPSPPKTKSKRPTRRRRRSPMGHLPAVPFRTGRRTLSF